MKGLIFIPDITGYTNFVNCVDTDLGISIIQELLNGIIDSNPLALEMSEIEGDAILYYKTGEPIPLDEIFAAVKKISEDFNCRYEKLKTLYNLKTDLSLKFIVHYGNINVYKIKDFRQLYGETVIESHGLLKNGSCSTNYILVTNDYLEALHQTDSNIFSVNKDFTYHCSDFFTGLRKVGYYFFSKCPKARDSNAFVLA
jgi:hypothetical protein